MSAYTKWNVPTLRDECESRGLIYDGLRLRKKDLIDLLRRNDEEAIEGDARSQDSDPGEVENDDVDDEIEMGGAHGSMTRVDTENVLCTPRLTMHGLKYSPFYQSAPRLRSLAIRPKQFYGPYGTAWSRAPPLISFDCFYKPFPFSYS